MRDGSGNRRKASCAQGWGAHCCLPNPKIITQIPMRVIAFCRKSSGRSHSFGKILSHSTASNSFYTRKVPNCFQSKVFNLSSLSSHDHLKRFNWICWEKSNLVFCISLFEIVLDEVPKGSGNFGGTMGWVYVRVGTNLVNAL